MVEPSPLVDYYGLWPDAWVETRIPNLIVAGLRE